MKRHPLSPTSSNRYIDKDPEFNSMIELSELEARIKHKIAQTKDKMHKTRERVVTDRLWPEIETLNWVLNEILVLSREP
jgi:hypothetical protein